MEPERTTDGQISHPAQTRRPRSKAEDHPRRRRCAAARLARVPGAQGDGKLHAKPPASSARRRRPASERFRRLRQARFNAPAPRRIEQRSGTAVAARGGIVDVEAPWPRRPPPDSSSRSAGSRARIPSRSGSIRILAPAREAPAARAPQAGPPVGPLGPNPGHGAPRPCSRCRPPPASRSTGSSRPWAWAPISRPRRLVFRLVALRFRQREDHDRGRLVRRRIGHRDAQEARP